MTRGTTSVYRLRGLIGYSHLKMVIYPQRDIGRTRRRLPLTRSFGARLRTVIGTLYLRSLAPPAAL